MKTRCLLLSWFPAVAWAFVAPNFLPHTLNGGYFTGSRIFADPSRQMMDWNRDQLLISNPVFVRRSMQCRIHSRKLNRLQSQSTSEDILISDETKTPIELVPSQSKLPSNPSKSAKVPSSVVDQDLAVAFRAFANSLLRPRGRVGFDIVASAFRREFPTFASADRFPDTMLGRRLREWYQESFGRPLNRTRAGVFMDLSVINPAYSPADLRSLRAAQVLFEPGMREKYDTLGVLAIAPPARDSKTKPNSPRTPQASAAAEGDGLNGSSVAKPKRGWRAMVVKNAAGQVVQVVRRSDSERGIKSKVLWNQRESRRSPSPQAPAPPRSAAEQAAAAAAARRNALSVAAGVCVESFANTALVPEGHVTFAEIVRVFRKEFPLLTTGVLPNSQLGRVLAEWYRRRHGSKLQRRKPGSESSPEGSQAGGDWVIRAEVPYVGLSFREDAAAAIADSAQLGQTKVALRRALGMEGVGVLARKVGGEFVVFSVVAGSPAAGVVKVGEALLAVDGVDVSGSSAQELADRVLGLPGTPVRLTLRAAPDSHGVTAATDDLVHEVELRRSDGATEGGAVARAEAAQRARDELDRALHLR